MKKVIFTSGLLFLNLFVNVTQSMETLHTVPAEPLFVAISKGDIGTVTQLLKVDANPAIVDSNGLTPLHYVVQYGHVAIAKFLIDHGANINANYNRFGFTPLHMAAHYGQTHIAQILINAAACLRAQDALGRTPLHEAAMNGHISTVELLIKFGPELTREGDVHNLLPRDLAGQNGYGDIIRILDAAEFPTFKLIEGYDDFGDD